MDSYFLPSFLKPLFFLGKSLYSFLVVYFLIDSSENQSTKNRLLFRQGLEELNPQTVPEVGEWVVDEQNFTFHLSNVAKK